MLVSPVFLFYFGCVGRRFKGFTVQRRWSFSRPCDVGQCSAGLQVQVLWYIA